MLEGQQLQPLPIKGLFYRWHVDLAGPFNTTSLALTHLVWCACFLCVESINHVHEWAGGP